MDGIKIKESQAKIITYFSKNNDPKNQKKISDDTKINHKWTSIIVKELEGYKILEEVDIKGKGKFYKLTNEGLKVSKHIKELAKHFR